jgi:4-amino-4-deoxy-L-arabinose transferase-like glycosyltransferase
MAVARARHIVTTLTVVALLVGALLVLGRRLHDDPRTALAADGTGSWWFPRGGPFILGFESPEHATLAIDGEVIAQGKGQVLKRLIYDAGVHSVAFTAPPSARLLWHPPGRRGAPEYVSPSSLSPDPPTRAEFTAPGTDHQGAAVMLGILVVLGWGLLALSRAFDDGRIYGPAVLIFVVALAARVWGLSQFGQTWDEDEYWSSGRNYVINILAGDTRPGSWRWNHEHPPITKYLAGAGALAQDGYLAARMIFAVLGAGACVLAFACGRRLFGGRAGFLAGLIAALLPHLVAHGRVVGHETPSVFFWTLAVWIALSAVEEDRARPGWLALRFAAIGVALGLAVGVRFTNLLVAPVLAAVILVLSRPHTLRATAIGLLTILPVAAATFVASWPRLWADPIGQIRASYGVLRNVHDPEPYLGVLTQHPPWHYFPVYVLATTPLLILVAAVLAGGVRAALARDRAWVVVLVWLVVPFVLAFSPVRQDGVRYVLPVLVPLAIAAGAGIDYLMDRLPRLAFPIGLVVLGYLGTVNWRIHPYQLDYYAEHVGGPARVADKDWFEIAWWGEGLGEAVRYINRRARRGASVARVAHPAHVTWLRGDLWHRITDRVTPETEWVLENPYGRRFGRGEPRLPPGTEPVFEVRAQGAVLARVYRLEPAAAKRP